MNDNIFLINQVIHDIETDSDYRILWTSSSDDQPSYWLNLPGSSILNVEKIFLFGCAQGVR